MIASVNSNYLGEVMVHKESGNVGPIVDTHVSIDAGAPELTLKTHDGRLIKGTPPEFEVANKEEYFSFVDGWLSKLSVSMY